MERRAHGLLGSCVFALVGCGPGPSAPPSDAVHAPAGPSVASSPAPVRPRPQSRAVLVDAPPETLLIESLSNGKLASCLGVLVAPRVALTASHCVEGRSGTRVRIAGSANGAFVAVERFWLDTRQHKDRRAVDRETADVSVLVLSRPIALASYPEIARRPAPGWIAATGLRRSGDHLETMALALRPPLGSPYYVSEPFAKPGDSGGAVFFVGPNGNRMVVAVTAGGNAEREVLTRVDLVAEAIDQAIEMSSGT